MRDGIWRRLPLPPIILTCQTTNTIVLQALADLQNPSPRDGQWCGLESTVAARTHTLSDFSLLSWRWWLSAARVLSGNYSLRAIACSLGLYSPRGVGFERERQHAAEAHRRIFGVHARGCYSGFLSRGDTRRNDHTTKTQVRQTQLMVGARKSASHIAHGMSGGS